MKRGATASLQRLYKLGAESAAPNYPHRLAPVHQLRTGHSAPRSAPRVKWKFFIRLASSIGIRSENCERVTSSPTLSERRCGALIRKPTSSLFVFRCVGTMIMTTAGQEKRSSGMVNSAGTTIYANSDNCRVGPFCTVCPKLTEHLPATSPRQSPLSKAGSCSRRGCFSLGFTVL